MSQSLGSLKDALKMTGGLLKLERRYPDPPRRRQQRVVRGLRGAASVLMVAAFENFLKEAIQEHLTVFSKSPPRVIFRKLPDGMQVHSVFGSLELAMRDRDSLKVQRLPDIERAARHMLQGLLAPEAFSVTRSNPSSATLKEMFKPLGYKNVCAEIKGTFDARWGGATATTFIEDKLDEIVARRHVVAHTANALNIARSDLHEAVRFLEVLSSVLDMELRRRVRELRRECR